MRLTVIGSGDASNAGGRGHSCYWLDGAGRAPFMVDFGATALMALKRCGRSPLELGGLAFTHLHGDHVGGFPFLFVDGMYGMRRQAPLTILGPVGVRERLRDLLRVTYGSLAEKEPPFAVEWLELRPGERQDLLGASLEGYPADHMHPPEQPLCLRVRGLDRAQLAFSGDTRMCEGLLAAARGVDLLVAECTELEPGKSAHCSLAEWQQTWPRVDARHVLLTHLGVDVRERVAALRGSLPEHVTFADDGLVLEVVGP